MVSPLISNSRVVYPHFLGVSTLSLHEGQIKVSPWFLLYNIRPSSYVILIHSIVNSIECFHFFHFILNTSIELISRAELMSGAE